MALYKLYASMSLGTILYEEECTKEFNSPSEAEKAAKNLAKKIYMSLEGINGVLSWEDCYQLLNTDYSSLFCDELAVDDFYNHEITAWTSWAVTPVYSTG